MSKLSKARDKKRDLARWLLLSEDLKAGRAVVEEAAAMSYRSFVAARYLPHRRLSEVSEYIGEKKGKT